MCRVAHLVRIQQLTQLPHVAQRQRRQAATTRWLLLLLTAGALLLLQPCQHHLPQPLPLCSWVWRILVSADSAALTSLAIKR